MNLPRAVTVLEGELAKGKEGDSLELPDALLIAIEAIELLIVLRLIPPKHVPKTLAHETP